MITKTLFVSALSCALAVSAALGRSPQQTHVTYDSSELQAKVDETAVLAGVRVDGDARTANLKFVLAIQRSTMWTDIKRRTVKISSSPRLAALLDADPASLSDEDLELLRRACHDGLKCVAVDQLLVLRSVTRTLPNGLVAVRQVITKITHVLTNYTTEYYEDTYQYEEVSDTESDPAKLDETVTVIVEDNKELCGIRVGDDVALMEDETKSTTVTRDAQKVVEGTVSVGSDGSDEDDASAEKTTPAAKTTTPVAKTTTPVAKTTTPAAAKTTPAAAKTTPAVAAKAAPKSLLVDDDGKEDDDDDNDDDDNDSAESADKSRSRVRVPSKNRDHGDLLDREARASGQAYRANDSAKPDAVKIPSSDQDEDDDFEGSDSSRSVTIANEDDGGDSGDSVTKADVASAGDNNATTVKKGYVEDGVMNNGDMNLYNVNTGTINKGIVNRSDADGGIVNVGTLNNGATNYGTANNYENYGTMEKFSKTDINQYLSSIDQMYSAIIDNFAKQ